MSAESPALTDAEEIKQGIGILLDQIESGHNEQNARLDAYRDALNAIGQNVQWLVDNTQGLFKFMSNPALMQQVMGMVAGGMPNGGQAAGDTGAAGPGGSGSEVLVDS